MTQLYRDTCSENTLRLCETERGCIAARMAAVGVQYAHVELPFCMALDPMTPTDEIIGAHIELLDPLIADWPSVDMTVTQVLPAHPRLDTVERQLMTEHTHDTPEAQLLVGGRGTLFMRAQSGRFCALACEPGDFVCLPAGMGHWFAMDRRIGFRTIRLFEDDNRPRKPSRGDDMRGQFTLLADPPSDNVAPEASG